jgi:hypothetical protein
LEAELAAAKDPWIDTEEVKPPIYERVLLTIEYVGEATRKPIRRTVDGYADSIIGAYAHWRGNAIDNRIWKVVAWQPWPDPASQKETP